MEKLKTLGRKFLHFAKLTLCWFFIVLSWVSYGLLIVLQNPDIDLATSSWLIINGMVLLILFILGYTEDLYGFGTRPIYQIVYAYAWFWGTTLILWIIGSLFCYLFNIEHSLGMMMWFSLLAIIVLIALLSSLLEFFMGLPKRWQKLRSKTKENWKADILKMGNELLEYLIIILAVLLTLAVSSLLVWGSYELGDYLGFWGSN